MSAARREAEIRKHQQKCLNFNGIMNDRCRAGIDYDEQAGGPPALKKLPCLLRMQDPDRAVACPSAHYPTREEAEAWREESSRHIREWAEEVGRGVCPNCKKDGRWRQVGRCVYCEGCGHRIYQGTLPDSKKPPRHEPPPLPFNSRFYDVPGESGMP
ncbi:hypothetical protein GBA65_15170 [Rubrobacter marinus]|uniref:Uncharacterized protein n=1 Tax=Rubrobacter marinus TaxID=2653852 RepID=A0A6G8PZM6_9ACTN|nr:hypothetical protein [Rubrobacter marinus]QIN79645.1 hypothetical protein GBA65_15170 [Rubrobacter marinus]